MGVAMSQAGSMLAAHPADLASVDRQALTRCIEACFSCAQACTACADACLSEERVAALAKCVRSNVDCADVCDTTGRILSRYTSHDPNLKRAILEMCAQTCKSCGDECERHAGMHEHCRVCAEECRRCERACREFLATLG